MNPNPDSVTDFIAVPRVDGLALSPDGARAVLTVATLSKDGTAYERALWEVPADGSGRPVRLTRSAKGEAGASFTSAGDLLFSSARPDGDAADDDPAQLWLLPATGGEARCVTRLAGGVGGIEAVASGAPVAILAAALMPSAQTLEDDARIRAARKKSKTSAILHAGYPVRYWDHDLGPGQATFLALDLSALPEDSAVAAQADSPQPDGSEAPDAPAAYPEHLPRPRDLTPAKRPLGDGSEAAISPDGDTVFATYAVTAGVSTRFRLVSIDVASGAHRTLCDEQDVDFHAPAVSPDGTRIAYVRSVKSTPEGATDQEMWVAGTDGSDASRIAAGWDRWPQSMQFSADGDALIVTADDDGRCPVFRIGLDGAVTRLTHDDYAYSGVCVDPTGGGLVALRSSWLEAPHPVRIGPDGQVKPLATPAPAPAVDATLTDVDATAADGTRVRGWLLTPPTASADRPAPLLLWIHGGPLNSWNAWSWRWCPALAVARGYAVLLPDPALSTGYGLDFINRGWNSWGDKPFTDLMTITDATVARPEIDGERTAAMGGSFGGYMANWVAGHTDRFDAVVTHASLWALDQFAPTTDHSGYWQSIFSPEAIAQYSPHHFVEDISTPMLVIHGDKDYRVPIGEGLRLWSDLMRVHGSDGPHRFLYFPDEHHWILKPQHAAVWYQTVFAFLGEHVLGEAGALPESLG